MSKKTIRFFFLGIFLIVTVFLSLFAPYGDGQVKTFVISKGESLFSIARRLELAGVVRSRWGFLLAVKITKSSEKIQAGAFQLRSNDSLGEIIKQLKSGRTDIWVTLIEGLRKEEIAIELSSRLDISLTDLLNQVEKKEGYLFPDTYLFPQDISVEQLVSIIIDNFEKKWQGIATEASKISLDQKQIITLASIVEREARLENDRRIVAGILIKRLMAGWPLQVDATVQYLKATERCKLKKGNLIVDSCNWWPQITKDDLKINSPFNTYLNKGLPPNPICNPSFSAIKSVIDFQKTEYWFYLSDKNGRIHFSETFEEHEDNIRIFLSP